MIKSSGKCKMTKMPSRAQHFTGKEVNIGLDEGREKLLRPADMLLYSWDRGLDVSVDLAASLPLMQTGMTDFVSDHAMIDAA
ncbi:hypothetical protein Tco_1460480 [Tanacetum coccineum]